MVILTKKVVVDYKISNIEGMTTDEAIKNVSSLYNTSKLTVTDLVSTGNATVNGTLNTGALYSKGNGGGGTHIPYTDGNNYITGNNNILRGGPTTVQGNLQVDGELNTGTIKAGGRMHISPGELLYLLPKNGVIVGKEWGGTGDLQVQGNLTVNGTSNLTGGIQAIVVDAPNWNTYYFREQITNGNYFKKNMPDGTTLRFLFVYPNRNASNMSIWNGLAIKIGNQFMIYDANPQHQGIGNPWSSGSSDLTWRGNIN